MTEFTDPLLLTAVFGAGALIGVAATALHRLVKKKSLRSLGEEILQKAESTASQKIKLAELQIKQMQLDLQKEQDIAWQSEKKKLRKEEERLQEREDKVEARMHLIEKKLSDIEKREAILQARKVQIDQDRTTVQTLKNSLQDSLSEISGLTASEAKEQLFNTFLEDVKKDAAHLIRKNMKEAEETQELEAKKIIVSSIQRLATSCTSETTVNTISIPGDDMKGRIIGREGRNIRALEMATGVNFVIDDTPGAVVLSSFDPGRLFIAKLTLTELMADGRIHPTRIEEVVEKSKILAAKQIRAFGQDAALKAGCPDLHPEILTLLGKLKLRFSYGQNILDHSLEVAHLMGMMAAELGLDVRAAKRIGLLHDMGKAVSHEVEGTHALIGRDLALKYGESPIVANGIGCHHFEIEAETIEASLCSAADAISASRPGARVEALEGYFKRLGHLEEMAHSYQGVEKAYAMQAGREVRVIVEPSKIDEAETLLLARNLTKQIEKELSYPGKIKVTVIREKRWVEYAL